MLTVYLYIIFCYFPLNIILFYDFLNYMLSDNVSNNYVHLSRIILTLVADFILLYVLERKKHNTQWVFAQYKDELFRRCPTYLTISPMVYHRANSEGGSKL